MKLQKATLDTISNYSNVKRQDNVGRTLNTFPTSASPMLTILILVDFFRPFCCSISQNTNAQWTAKESADTVLYRGIICGPNRNHFKAVFPSQTCRFFENIRSLISPYLHISNSVAFVTAALYIHGEWVRANVPSLQSRTLSLRYIVDIVRWTSQGPRS